VLRRVLGRVVLVHARVVYRDVQPAQACHSLRHHPGLPCGPDLLMDRSTIACRQHCARRMDAEAICCTAVGCRLGPLACALCLQKNQTAARQASEASGRWAHRSQSAARVMSATTARLRTPLAASSAAVASAVARTTSTTATAAPASPSACANARPMPWPPPGMRARAAAQRRAARAGAHARGQSVRTGGWWMADKHGMRTAAHACKPTPCYLSLIKSGLDTFPWLACHR
jgi:hypothetical protein